jgi:branched-chain amino acid transport system substrate-binding protein
MKNVLIKCLVLVFMMLVFSSFVWAQERPIRILIVDAFSGPAKDNGDRYLLGLQFAAEEINAQGGLMGRKVEIIAEDSQVKPDVAVRKAQKYLLEGSVDVVTAGTGSHVAKALADLTNQHNVLFVNFTMSDEATGKDFTNNAIRLVYSTSMMGRALVAYVAKNTQFKKFYLLNQDYAYGRDMGAAFKREVTRQIPTAQIVGEDYHPLFAKDFSPFLTKIKASNADAILTANYATDISILLKQRNELGIKATVVNNALANPTVVREIPEAAQGNIACDAFMITTKTQENADFVSRWQKRYAGAEYPVPDCVSGRTYIGLRFLSQGIQKAGSVRLEKLMPVLEGMHQKSLNGDIYLRPCDHQLQSPMPVVTVQSKTPPYFSVPVMIPASEIEIAETEIDNPRCKKK